MTRGPRLHSPWLLTPARCNDWRSRAARSPAHRRPRWVFAWCSLVQVWHLTLPTLGVGFINMSLCVSQPLQPSHSLFSYCLSKLGAVGLPEAEMRRCPVWAVTHSAPSCPLLWKQAGAFCATHRHSDARQGPQEGPGAGSLDSVSLPVPGSMGSLQAVDGQDFLPLGHVSSVHRIFTVLPKATGVNGIKKGSAPH